jgi:hypothetical protein
MIGGAICGGTMMFAVEAAGVIRARTRFTGLMIFGACTVRVTMPGASGAVGMTVAVGSAASMVVEGDTVALTMFWKASAELLDLERDSLSLTSFRIDSVEPSVFCARITVGTFLQHPISHCPRNCSATAMKRKTNRCDGNVTQ